MHIGIAGTGRMGTAIATRLVEMGHSVSVWNRTAANLASVKNLNLKAFDTAAELASGTDVILTLLTDKTAIESVYDSELGLLAGTLKDKLVIDMSTVQPETTQALAQRVRKRGAVFVECPVGGTVAPALAGKLIGFAGGNEADIERARPILEQLCRRLEHVGPVGAGASVKLAINLPLVVYWQALGEALSLCRHLNLDAARLVDILADTSGGPTVMKNRAEIVTRALDGEQIPGTFDVNQMRKDINTMLAEAELLGNRLPVTAATLEALNESADGGLANADGAVHSASWR